MHGEKKSLIDLNAFLELLPCSFGLARPFRASKINEVESGQEESSLRLILTFLQHNE